MSVDDLSFSHLESNFMIDSLVGQVGSERLSQNKEERLALCENSD